MPDEKATGEWTAIIGYINNDGYIHVYQMLVIQHAFLLGKINWSKTATI